VEEVALMTMKEIKGAETSASNSRSRRVRVYISAAAQEFATCPVRQGVLEYNKITTKISKRSISKPIRLELHIYRVFIVYSDNPLG
jgi:hypothetical protein